MLAPRQVLTGRPSGLGAGKPLRVLEVLEATMGGTKQHLLDLLAGFSQRDDLEVEVACPEVRIGNARDRRALAELRALGIPLHRLPTHDDLDAWADLSTLQRLLAHNGRAQTWQHSGHLGDLSFVTAARQLGVPLHLVDMQRALDPRSDLPALWHLTRLIRAGRYDIVHLHSSKAGALGRLATWLAFAGQPQRRPKVVYTPNGWSFLIPGSRKRRLFYTAVEWLLGRLTDRLIVISEDERNEALRRRIVPANRLRLVRSGVAFESLPSGSVGDAKRLELGWGRRGTTTVIGTVARLTPQKDPFTWVRAVALAQSRRPGLHFVWVGNGELEGEFLALARELGLDRQGRFEYLGYRSDARELIAAMDVFTLSSVFEAGLPYVLMEAMALGRPVVSTAGSGNRELIEHGLNGYLVPPGDAAALAEHILRLADDAALRERFGLAGRRTVLDFCTTNRQVDETASVYYDALGLSDLDPITDATIRRVPART